MSLQRWVDMAITSLTLSSMCGCTWLQSSAPPPPPPPMPWLRACCYSSTHLSVHKTLTHIHSSGVIACLRANRSLSLSLSLILYLGTVLLSYTLINRLVTVSFFSSWIAQSWHWKLHMLHLVAASQLWVLFFFFTNFSFISFINWTRVSCQVNCLNN